MSTVADAPSTKQRAEKNGTKIILPTDRISAPKQLDLLRGWAAASGPSNKPVTNEDVSAIVKMAPSTIQMANAFFVDLGFLQKSGPTYVPCAEVMSFNRAHEWNPENAPHKLATIVEQSWFGQAILPRLAFASISEREAIEALV